MSYNLIIKEEAKEDIDDTFFWYNRINTKLGQRFIDEVEDVIFHIKNYPLHFQVVEHNFRQRILQSFPYLVIYKVIGNEVIVYALFPAKDNPKKRPSN